VQKTKDDPRSRTNQHEPKHSCLEPDPTFEAKLRQGVLWLTKFAPPEQEQFRGSFQRSEMFIASGCRFRFSQSVKQTTESSPPINRWGSRRKKIRSPWSGRLIPNRETLVPFSRPLHGLGLFETLFPALKVLGYFQLSVSRTN